MPEGRAQYDVGILFVHGIGEQPRADTLIRFGDPLCAWIERWCSEMNSPGQERPVAVRASLRLPPEDSAERPCAELRVGGPTPDGSTKETYWLLAESWWAECFATPRYLELVKWSFGVVPWTIQSHYGTRVRRAVKRFQTAGTAGRRIWSVIECGVDALFLLSAPFFAAALLLLASLLLLVAIPPIPQLRAFLVKVQSKLAATIGDSYVLLSSPIQAAAIASHVIRDLEWLLETKKCRAVALVAHSQGAAVTHEALRRGLPLGLTKDNCLLFTFGSGLNKLEELRWAQNSGLIKSAWLGLIGGLVMLWGPLLMWFGVLSIGNLDPAVRGWLALIAGYLLWVIGVSITAKSPAFKEDDFNPASRFGVALPWVDYYASLDPVPNGPLYDEDKTPPYLRGNSVEVHNRCAVLRDHNSYWKNPDAFVSAVACAVGKLAGLALDNVQPGDTEWLLLARLRRRWRVRWLAAARVLAGIALVVLPLAFRKSLVGLGGLLLLVLSWVTEEVTAALPLTAETGQQLLALLQAHTTELGVLVLLGLVLAIYAVLYGLWKWWEGDDVSKFFRRESFRLGWSFLLFVVSTVVLADVVFLSVLSWVAPREVFTSWWGLALGVVFLIAEVYAIFGPAANFLEERSAALQLAEQLKPQNPEQARRLRDDYAYRAVQPHANELIEVSQQLAQQDPERARRILEGPAELFPEAAIALAELVAPDDPEKAKAVLRPHAEKDAAARQALEKLSFGSTNLNKR